MKKTVKSLFALVLCACLLLPLCLPASAATVKLGKYGTAAQKYFSVASANIRKVSASADSTKIAEALKALGEAYVSTSKTQMLYVPSGTHKLYGQLTVPKGVILCGETDSVFDSRLPAGSPAVILVWVYGSVYGGKYNCNQDCDILMRFGNCSFSKPNGYIMYTKLSGPVLTAISALGSKTKGARVMYNTISNCGKDCIGSMYGATIQLIYGNKLSKAKQSGIDITHANVVRIAKNKISNVTGHGISTDTEQKGKAHAFCRITTVENNTITGAGHHGVYLEENCKITGHMKNNVITNCTLNGVCISKKASIGSHENKKYFMRNTVSGSGHSNISLEGADSVLYMGTGNIIEKSKSAGITVGSNAKLYIRGKDNYIRDNEMNGVQMSSNGYMKTYGSTYFMNNRWGVNMNKGAKAYLNYCTFRGNSKGAVYYVSGATYSSKNCDIEGKVYKLV